MIQGGFPDPYPKRMCLIDGILLVFQGETFRVAHIIVVVLVAVVGFIFYVRPDCPILTGRILMFCLVLALSLLGFFLLFATRVYCG